MDSWTRVKVMTVYGTPFTGRRVRVRLDNGASEGCIVSGSLLTPCLSYSSSSSHTFLREH